MKRLLAWLTLLMAFMIAAVMGAALNLAVRFTWGILATEEGWVVFQETLAPWLPCAAGSRRETNMMSEAKVCLAHARRELPAGYTVTDDDLQWTWVPVSYIAEDTPRNPTERTLTHRVLPGEWLREQRLQKAP